MRKADFPSAVQRNRAKRLIREVFRRNKGHLSKGLDIVIKPKSSNILSLEYKDIEKELSTMFKEVKALTKG